MKLSELKGGTMPVEVDLGDIVLNLVVKPRVLTADYIERFLNDDEVGITVTGDALSAAIESWDLTEDNGEMVPVTRESLMANFRPPDLRNMLSTIANASLPKATPKSGSVSTSRGATEQAST